MTNALGTVTITVKFVGDIDDLYNQDEFVDISCTGTGTPVVIGRLRFDNNAQSENACGSDGPLSFGARCCVDGIERSFEVDGAVVKNCSFLNFDTSDDVNVFTNCDNVFTTTVTYCSDDDAPLLI